AHPVLLDEAHQVLEGRHRAGHVDPLGHHIGDCAVPEQRAHQRARSATSTGMSVPRSRSCVTDPNNKLVRSPTRLEPTTRTSALHWAAAAATSRATWEDSATRDSAGTPASRSIAVAVSTVYVTSS